MSATGTVRYYKVPEGYGLFDPLFIFLQRKEGWTKTRGKGYFNSFNRTGSVYWILLLKTDSIFTVPIQSDSFYYINGMIYTSILPLAGS